PYNVEETKKLLAEVVKEEGVKVVIARALCYLKFSREGRVSFEARKVTVDHEVCNGCKICVSDFGCPAITIVDGKARIDQDSCNGCGVCVSVCARGAMK
ncbi:MAG: indolepyruvate ferredoxin oxidoreductase subunit alpha, partial [Bacillota bacterium]